jgi:hypothetical protein
MKPETETSTSSQRAYEIRYLKPDGKTAIFITDEAAGIGVVCPEILPQTQELEAPLRSSSTNPPPRPCMIAFSGSHLLRPNVNSAGSG